MTTVLIFQDRRVRADALLNSPREINRLTRGETATLQLLDPSDTLLVETGGTVTISQGDTESYDFVEVESGGTLDVDGTLNINERLINNGTVDNDGTINIQDGEQTDVTEYARYAGKYTVSETLGGEQKYRERLPSDSSVSSLLVKFEPKESLQNRQIPGVFGLIDGVTDTRGPALSQNEFEVTVRILATTQEYNTLTDVQNELEV